MTPLQRHSEQQRAAQPPNTACGCVSGRSTTSTLLERTLPLLALSCLSRRLECVAHAAASSEPPSPQRPLQRGVGRSAMLGPPLGHQPHITQRSPHHLTQQHWRNAASAHGGLSREHRMCHRWQPRARRGAVVGPPPMIVPLAVQEPPTMGTSPCSGSLCYQCCARPRRRHGLAHNAQLRVLPTTQQLRNGSPSVCSSLNSRTRSRLRALASDALLSNLLAVLPIVDHLAAVLVLRCTALVSCGWAALVELTQHLSGGWVRGLQISCRRRCRNTANWSRGHLLICSADGSLRRGGTRPRCGCHSCASLCAIPHDGVESAAEVVCAPLLEQPAALLGQLRCAALRTAD
jgi:hypothetical protein